MKLFLSVLFFSLSLFADNSCLPTVTNDELLRELSYRLGSGNPYPPPAGNFVPNFTCSTWTLKVSVLNMSNGQENRKDISVTDSNSCNEYEKFLSSRLENRSLYTSKMFAVCNSWTLIRVILTADGRINQLPNQSMNDSAACNTEATQINSQL